MCTCLDIEQVVKSYEEDKFCTDLITKLSIDSQAMPNYTLSNGLIRYKGKLLIGANGELRQQLLQSFHQSALGGHSGERATCQRMKLVFFWPKMHQEIKDFVRQCPTC